jgi:hypothetical protein
MWCVTVSFNSVTVVVFRGGVGHSGGGSPAARSLGGLGRLVLRRRGLGLRLRRGLRRSLRRSMRRSLRLEVHRVVRRMVRRVVRHHAGDRRALAEQRVVLHQRVPRPLAHVHVDGLGVAVLGVHGLRCNLGGVHEVLVRVLPDLTEVLRKYNSIFFFFCFELSKKVGQQIIKKGTKKKKYTRWPHTCWRLASATIPETITRAPTSRRTAASCSMRLCWTTGTRDEKARAC